MHEPPKATGFRPPRPGCVAAVRSPAFPPAFPMFPPGKRSALGFAWELAASTGREPSPAAPAPFRSDKGVALPCAGSRPPCQAAPGPGMTKCPLVNCGTDRLELKVLIYTTMALTAQ